MTVAELLSQFCLAESLLGEVRFSVNCVTLEIFIQPGVFIAADTPNPNSIAISFEHCLLFEMKRSNVAEFAKDQLFLVHDGARTITVAVEDRSIIPPSWRTKYDSALNCLVIETVDLMLSVICFGVSVR
jgi:hypothetical protein